MVDQIAPDAEEPNSGPIKPRARNKDARLAIFSCVKTDL